MSDEEIQQLSTDFSPINDYGEALLFWDRHGFDFRDDHKMTDDGEVSISIIPKNGIERRLYNKWIIDHWCNYYITKEYSDGQVTESIDLVFKNFDTLKSDYFDRLALGCKTAEVIADEIRITDAKLSLLANNPQNAKLITAIYKRFKSGHQSEFYEYMPSAANRFIKLRLLAKAWDLTLYKIFLENEDKQLRENKIYELDFYVVKKFNIQQMESLYKFLVDGRYMECSLTLFKQVFRSVPKDNEEKILWVDTSLRKKEINKQTLFQLVLSLMSGAPYSTTILYKFIQNSFKTNKIVKSVDGPLKENNLKQSYFVFRKTDDIQDKQKALSDFIKRLSNS